MITLMRNMIEYWLEIKEGIAQGLVILVLETIIVFLIKLLIDNFMSKL